MGEVVQLNFAKPPRNVQKLKVFRELLEHGVVLIMLDASREGVLVPSEFSGKQMLGLNFAYDYDLPDFGFDERGVSATLEFVEGYFFCKVPWEAVYRIGDRFWREDFP